MRAKGWIMLIALSMLTGFNGTAQNNAYGEYYKLTQQIDNFVLKNKLDSAEIYFDALFSKYDKLFYTTLRNAFVVYEANRNYNKAQKAAEMLVAKGEDLDFFAKHNRGLFLKTKHGKRFARNFAKYSKPINNIIWQHDTLRNMVVVDQHYRRNVTDQDQVDSVYHLNMARFVTFIEKDGWNEIFSSKLAVNAGTAVMFLHYAEMRLRYKAKCEADSLPIDNCMRYGYIDLVEKLKEWVDKGIFYMDILETIHSLYSRHEKSSVALVFDYQKEMVSIKLPSDVVIEQINNKRKEFGLIELPENYVEFMTNFWADFDFKNLKSRYAECRDSADQYCFTILLSEEIDKHYRNKLEKVYLENYQLFFVSKPKLFYRFDKEFRESIRYGVNSN
jgi:predicted transcriptional regulator